MKDKLIIVFVPFLLSLLGMTIGYSFLHWALFIKFNIFNLQENITEIVIPLVLSGIITYFFIHPRIKALQLRDSSFHVIVAWLCLTVPTTIAQIYMVKATGRLTILNSIEKIESHEPTKYYQVASYHVDTRTPYYYVTYDISGKHSEKFNMYLYAVMPVYKTDTDTVSNRPHAWLGISYKEDISNWMSHEKKEEALNTFVRRSKAQIKYGNFSSFVCFERVDKSSKNYEGFQNALSQNVYGTSEETILTGMDTPYEARNDGKLQHLFIAMLIAFVLWLLMSIIPKSNKKEMKRIKAGKPDRKAQIERQETLNAIIPHESFFITPIIIYINVSVFLLMILSGAGFITFQADDLLNWGANYTPYLIEGQWWRLLTSTFLHGGVMHLVVNMTYLGYMGYELEYRMSRILYLCIYLISGLAASITSALWNDTPTVSVGASGAIFGLCGVFIALLLTQSYPHSNVKSKLTGVAFFIGINLFAGILPGIDNAAHVGGLLVGFVIGLAISPFIKKQHSG